MQHQFSKIGATAPKTALSAALLISACAHVLAAGPAQFRPMQISIHPRVLSTGANFSQFGPNAIMAGGTCSATCCGPDGLGGTICASASAGMPSGYYPGPCIDLNAICSAEAAAVSGGGVTCTCGCHIACSDSGGPTGNLSGNGITTGVGGLANDFGTTRLAGPDEGLPTFTSHATTANQQWMEENIRRQTAALQSLRQIPEPQSTMDYEARYLNRTTAAPNKPEAPSCPDDTSMVCLIGTTSQTPNMDKLGEKESSGKGSPAGSNMPGTARDSGAASEVPAPPEAGDDRNDLNEKIKDAYKDEVKDSMLESVKDAIKEHVPGTDGLVDRVASTIEGAGIYTDYVQNLLPTVFGMINAGARGDMDAYNEGQAKLDAGSQDLQNKTSDFTMKQTGYSEPINDAKKQGASAFFNSLTK